MSAQQAINVAKAARTGTGFAECGKGSFGVTAGLGGVGGSYERMQSGPITAQNHGVGAKVWESSNDAASLGVGASRSQAHLSGYGSSKPQYAGGMSFNFKF